MIVLDSSVLIALYNESDSQHEKAVAVARRLTQFVLFEYVIIETASVLSKKAGVEVANRFLEYALGSTDVSVLYSSPEAFHECVALVRTLGDPALSFVDVSLAYLSRQYEVITFDDHLNKAIAKMH